MSSCSHLDVWLSDSRSSHSTLDFSVPTRDATCLYMTTPSNLVSLKSVHHRVQGSSPLRPPPLWPPCSDLAWPVAVAIQGSLCLRGGQDPPPRDLTACEARLCGAPVSTGTFVCSVLLSSCLQPSDLLVPPRLCPVHCCLGAWELLASSV